MFMPLVKWSLIVMCIVTLLVMAVLSMPVPLWRTGEAPQPELRYSSPSSPSQMPAKQARVWIDADAACGSGERRGADDCLALLPLANASHVDIAGISTVFGNAPVDVTDQVMRALVQELGTYAGKPVSTALPMFGGCGAAAPRCLEDGGGLNAQAALRQALQRGPLDAEMLGPLTDLAAVAFDPMAAACVRNPARFACARLTAWVGDDALLPWFGGGPALLVAQPAGAPVPAPAPAQVLYCDVVRVSVDELFLSRALRASGGPGQKPLPTVECGRNPFLWEASDCVRKRTD